MGRFDGSPGARAALARVEQAAPLPPTRLKAACLRALADAVEHGVADAQDTALVAFDELADAIQRATTRLSSLLRTHPASSKTQSRLDLIMTLQELRWDLRERELRERLDAVSEVQDGLDRLRAVQQPEELLQRVAEEVCRSCGFERCVVSKVDGVDWIVERAHFVHDPDGAITYVAGLHGRRVRLEHSVVESEMTRRRAAVLVLDAQEDPRTAKPIVAPAQTTSYVGAPIVVRDRVIGFLHADHGAKGATVGTIDRDVLRAFTEGFGQIYERTVLVDRLSAQHDHVRQMVRTTGAVMDELCESDIELARADDKNAHVARTAAALFVAPETRIETLLTRREMEVLALMASGVSNAVVAEKLVISEGTVKSHVKHILRKLRASNRAEAVARYLHMYLDHDRDRVPDGGPRR